MARTAAVVGATGQTGPAAVRALGEDGWTVRPPGRTGRDAGWGSERDVETVRADRDHRRLAADPRS